MAASRDYYLELPLHFMQDPAMLRLIMRDGMEAVGIYTALCTSLAIAYNENRSLDKNGLEALAFSWHVDYSHLLDMCDDMAEVGLISGELWGDGKIGIDLVAERMLYKQKKALAGSLGGKKRAETAGQGTDCEH